MTLLLYLNGAPPGASGGELRSYVGAEPSDLDGDTAVRVDDIQPRAGRLVLFESRTLLHAVRPVGLWRRVALSLWCLKRIDATDRLSPLADDVLGADAFLHLNAQSLARLAMCARVFGKKKDGRSLCDEAARQGVSALREKFSTGVKSIDGMDWFVERQIPSWIYCLYDGETNNLLGDRRRHGGADPSFDRLVRNHKRKTRKRAVDMIRHRIHMDNIRHHIHMSRLRTEEAVADFIDELRRDGAIRD